MGHPNQTMRTGPRVLVVNNVPAPFLLPLFRRLEESTDWELTVCYVSRTSPTTGWDGRASSLELTSRAVFLGDRDRGINAAKALRLLRLVRELRPMVLVCYGYTGAVQVTAIVWAVLNRVPVALIGDANYLADRCRGFVRRWLKKISLRLLVKRAKVCFFVGTANRRYWEKYGAQPNQLREAKYTIDARSFASACLAAQPDAQRLRRALGVQGKTVFLYVGRLIERKNVVTLVEAARRLSSDKAVLLVVGDGDGRDRVERAASGARNVVMVGRVRHSRLPRLYAMADVLVLPSADEPWGLVVNEAVASGLAVIVHQDCGAALDLVRSTSGITLASHSVNELAAAMCRLTDAPAVLEGMKRAAGEISDEWSIEQTVVGFLSGVQYALRSS